MSKSAMFLCYLVRKHSACSPLARANIPKQKIPIEYYSRDVRPVKDALDLTQSLIVIIKTNLLKTKSESCSLVFDATNLLDWRLMTRCDSLDTEWQHSGSLQAKTGSTASDTPLAAPHLSFHKTPAPVQWMWECLTWVANILQQPLWSRSQNSFFQHELVRRCRRLHLHMLTF